VALTTIRLNSNLKRTLKAMKLHPRETYNDVLERILEDLSELNEKTKKEIDRALREVQSGKYKTHEQIKAELGF